MPNWNATFAILLASLPALAAPVNDFSIAASPSTQKLPAGLTALYTISTAATAGTAQTVFLSASGLPAGVTAVFSPRWVTAGGSSTLKLTATACATNATKQFTVTGIATTKHSAPAQVQVVAGPSVSITSPSPNSVVAGTVTISAAAIGCKSISRIDVSVDGTLLISGPGATARYAWDTSGWPAGAHTITAHAYDSTGKVGPDTIVRVSVQNPPAILLVYPAEGEAGDVVQVIGTRLDSVVSVAVGGAAAPFTLTNPNPSLGTLNVTVPAGAVIGSTELVVTNAAGSTAASFLVHDRTPWILSVSPPAAGPGAKVMLVGHHLVAVEGVWLGAGRAYASSGGGTGSNEIGGLSAWVPDDATTGAIRIVSALRGTGASGSFTVLPPLSMSPSSGPPGTAVLLEGPGLGSATAVSFLDVPAAFTAIDATHLQTWVPANATTSHIVVQTSDGAPSTPVFVVPRIGALRTLVMRVQPLDRTQDCTNDQLQSIFFGATRSADALFGSASGGRMRVTGDVVGPLVVPYTDAGCTDYQPWLAAANDLARQAGYDPATYAEKVYALPANPCRSGGVDVPGVIAYPAATCGPGNEVEATYDLGRSLGLQNAGTPGVAFGDPTDVMGGFFYVGPNAPHRMQLGWLADSAWTSLSAGSATLAPLDGSSSRLQVAWIPGRENDFIVSYVRRIDTASQDLSEADADRVLVHAVSHEPTSGMYPLTVLHAALTAGDSFTSPEEGIRVDVLSLGAAGAQVAISSIAPTCFRNFPTLSVGPARQSAAPGTSLTYAISITNNDGGACPASTWSLSGASTALSGAWSFQFDPPVTLNAGQSATASVIIKSPIDAEPQDVSFYPGIADYADRFDHPEIPPTSFVVHYVVVQRQ